MESQQLNLVDYVQLQRKVIKESRYRIALELTAQAEELMRSSEHHTFESALALLERLRKDEPHNASVKEQVMQEISLSANAK